LHYKHSEHNIVFLFAIVDKYFKESEEEKEEEEEENE
jgi:hypothetical protein